MDFISKIDIKKLSRDFNKEPLRKKIKGYYTEEIPESDLKYLFIELNLNMEEVAKFFKVSSALISSRLKLFGIKKSIWQQKERERITMIERYGAEHPMLIPEIKEKYERTCLEKYGTISSNSSPEVKEKQKQGYLRNWGVDSPMKSEVIKEIMKRNNLKRRGVEWVMQDSKVVDKSRSTCLEKYGKVSYCQTKECSEKSYQIKKRNGTLSTSSPEMRIYKFLEHRYKDVKSQYRDERYPFACDFYIPSLDLFIEYQGHWSHGESSGPFNKNNPEHINKLNKWKIKSTETNFSGKPKQSYLDAIKAWTISDVEKRELAKRNKLNWLEFFNEKDLYNYFEKL